MQLINSLFPMSHSAINTYDTCPNKFRAMYVDKEVKYSTSAAADFGTALHALIERYVFAVRRGSTDVIAEYEKPRLNERTLLAALSHARAKPLVYPPDMFELSMHFKAAKKTLDALDAQDVKVEQTLGIKVYDNGETLTLEACDYFDKLCTFRAKIDINVDFGSSALIIDWKSGKTLKDDGQLVRSMACVLVNDPTKVTASAILNPTRPEVEALPAKVLSKAALEREVLNTIVVPITAINRAKAENYWPAVRSGLCKDYCDVTSCTYCGKKK